MQLHLTLAAEEIRLPIACNETIQGLIYHALQTAPSYSSFMHNVGLHADGRAFKLFHFGEPKCRYRTDPLQ